MSQRRYVFVGGLHKSGTSLVAQHLGRHPLVSAFRDTGFPEDEGQFLQSVFATDNVAGGPGRFAFDPTMHLTEGSALLTADSRRTLQSEWHARWDQGRPALLEKSPANIIRARFLQAVFEPAYFVFVCRNPAVVSLATQKWSGTGIYALIHHWLVAHEILGSDLAHLARYAIVAYEAFVQDPQTTLDRIFAFLGLESSPAGAIAPAPVDPYAEVWRSVYLSSQDRRRPAPPRRERESNVFDRRNASAESHLRQTLVPFQINTRDGSTMSLTQKSLPNREAQDATAMFEAPIQRFGYSLVDLQRYPVFRSHPPV